MSRRALHLALAGLLVATTAACGTHVPFPAGGVVGSLSALAKRAPAPAAASGPLRLVTLPEAGDAFFLRALRQARGAIRLQVYLLTHQGVIAELAAAKARGVDVQVILEPKPLNQAMVKNPANPKGPKVPANQLAAMQLAAAGVPVTWSSDAFTFTHAKAMTLDNQVTFVSTANFTRSGLSADGDGSREYVIEDPVPADVAEFGALFEADRAHQPYQPTNPNLVVSPVNARAKIMGLIASAHREVTIQMEVAGDPAVDALVAAKVKEGVHVRALLADLGNHKTPNGGTNGATARTWLAAGADVRYQDDPHLHGKAVVVDGQAMYVGSVNLTTNSLDQNRELGLIVQQPDLVGQVAATFEHDWAQARSTTKHPPLKLPKLHHHRLIGVELPDDPDTDDEDDDPIDEDPV